VYRYARLKHDFQLEEYGFHKRKNWLSITPETVTFNNKPDEGKGPALRLSKPWFKFVRDLNSDKGFAVATDPKTGWVNEGWGDHETPLVQSLSMAGNVVIVREISDEYGRLLSSRGENPPPDPARFNFFEAPQYVHKFSCIGDNDKIRNPRNGVDSYYPLLGAGDLWVPMRKVELFPEVPCKIQTEASAFLRSSPKKAYANVIGGLFRGQLLTLQGYAARGTHVWGFVTTEKGKSGFVALLWYPTAASLHYLTSWRMETVPTLPPK
jgi:hypothetical protein